MTLGLSIFDTKSRKKEVLIPVQNNVIRMYTCGPTVYNFPHIGNLRTYVFEDILRRTIRYFGMEVFQVMNLTDVDDKTIKNAIQSKLSLLDATRPYKEAFFEDLETLGIEKAEAYPEATEYVTEMIGLIEVLIQKGIAYVGHEGSVFYRISKFSEYGKLSHLSLEDLKVGASNRVESDEYDKENLSDFVLWKAYDPMRDGEIYWDSPWGKGRPGWHIECSAMAMHYFGPTLDLHVGGVDNIFPHHENEIAQSEGCTGKTFARHWMHANHLIVEGKKMSKSLGNFYTLRDLLKLGYTGKEVRYLLLSTHYRMQLNFTFESLKGARSSLKRLTDFYLRIRGIKGEGKAIDEVIGRARESFKRALGDDLNIAEALASIFEFVREVNTLCDEGVIGIEEAKRIELLIREFDEILGIWNFEDEAIPEEILKLVHERQEARKAKKWAVSDALRDKILESGYLLEDGAEGATVKKIHDNN